MTTGHALEVINLLVDGLVLVEDNNGANHCAEKHMKRMAIGTHTHTHIQTH